jgi:hypothetical protein
MVGLIGGIFSSRFGAGAPQTPRACAQRLRRPGRLAAQARLSFTAGKSSGTSKATFT